MTALPAHTLDALARAVLGAPDAAVSTATKLRFGRYSLDLSKGRLYDFEEESSVTIETVVAREKGLSDEDAIAWVNDHLEPKPNGANGHHEEPADLPDELADERALIGLILLKPDVLKFAEEEVAATDFLSDIHATIFRLFLDARDQDYRADIRTVVGALTGEGLRTPSGYTIATYVARLAACAPFMGDDAADDVARRLARQIRQFAEVERGNEPEPESTAPEPFEWKLGPVRWHEQDIGRHEQEWAVKKLVPLRSKLMIVGAKQSGKSFFGESMALALSRGVDFFGYRVPKPFGVIYAAVEAGAGFRNRMKAYRKHHGLSLDPLPFAVLTGEFNLFNASQDVEKVVQECLALAAEFSVPLGAIVIDTYNAATAGLDENSAGQVASVVSKINEIMRRTGAGVWLVHHKNALGGIRGSTGLPAAFETVIEISRIVDGQMGPLRDAERREVRNARVMYQREGVEGDTFNFVLPSVEISRDADGDPVTSCVVAPPAAAPGEAHSTARGFVLRTSNARTSYEALISALGEHGGKPPADGAVKAPRRALVVHRDFWRDTLLRSAIGSKHDDPTQRSEHVKKVLQRAMEKLGQWGLIGVDYPWVWRTSKLVSGYDPPPHAYEEAREADPFDDAENLFGT